MHKFFFFLCLCVGISAANGQYILADSFRHQLQVAKHDTAKVLLMADLSDAYRWNAPDTALDYANRGLKLAQDIGYKRGVALLTCYQAAAWWSFGEYATSLKLLLSSRKTILESGDRISIEMISRIMLWCYRDQGEYETAFRYIEKDSTTVKRIKWAVIVDLYQKMGLLDSATHYLSGIFNSPPIPGINGWPYYVAGEVYRATKQYDSAFKYYRLSVGQLAEEGNFKDLSGTYNRLASLSLFLGVRDSARFFSEKSLRIAKERKFAKEMMEAFLQISASYEGVNADSALHYYKLGVEAKDILFDRQKRLQVKSFEFNEQIRLQEIENARQQYRSRLRTGIAAGLAAAFLLIGLLLWRNNMIKQRSNQKLKQQVDKTEEALAALKQTQSQLIQSEKMASLGELTAGIAHEIQNPLNFVNNFSEVSKELIQEVKNERSKVKSERDESLEEDLLNDIEQNLDKIQHHGKRADAIVKGMLAHSRTGSGQIEPTDINALCDEYLRLAYHGLKAKDSSFNVTVKSEFDGSIGNINIIKQDIGRVILNLISNAFYVVDEKLKQGITGYEPTIGISTRKEGNNVLIAVKDNGSGIPEKLQDKIFQPFFTTKPTGQGTGLGLSLSYDIVKAHGGEIRVESIEQEGSTFTIVLPLVL